MVEANSIWPEAAAGGAMPRLPLDLPSLERLFEPAPIAVAVVSGPEHRYVLANAAHRALAHDRGLLLGRRFGEIWPELQDSLLPALDRVRASAEPYRAANVALRLELEGRRVERYFSLTCSAIGSEVGPAEAILLLVDDTTDDVRERRSHDEALSLFDRLLAAAPIGIAFLDRELRFVHVNDALAAVNGLPAASHVGRTRAELQPGLRNAEAIADWMHRVVESGEPALGIEVALDSTGEPGGRRHFRESWYPLRLGDDIIGIGAIVEEITAHKRAETERDDLLRSEQVARAGAETANARLRELNQQLVATSLRTHEMEQQQRLLAEFSHALAASLDYASTVEQVIRFPTRQFADYCVLYTVDDDSSIYRIAGAHADPTKDRALRELHGLDGSIPVSREGAIARVIATGQTHFVPQVSGEWIRAITQSPEHAHVIATAAPSSIIVTALTAHGRTVGVLSFMQTDPARHFREASVKVAEALTERAAIALDNARLYEHAQAAERRYRTVFEGVGDALLVASEDGRYIEANPAAERLLGYTAEEIRRHRVGDFAIEGEATAQRAREALATAGEHRAEMLLRRADGSAVPVESYARILDLPTGPIHVSALRDISERRDLERLQQEFIALVTHELRSPLTSIRGFAQLMQRQGQFSASAVEAIIGQTIRQERLVNDLLDVSRIQTGRLALQTERVELIGLVQAVAAEAQVLTRSHAISVVTPPRLPLGRWDRGRLEQVFNNLLSNAIKYSPNGGEVLVTVVDTGDCARVSIADEGQGIPAEALPHVFERFYRAGSDQVVGGLGLGLHIVQSLVEAHGGVITVDSTPGRGSRFTVELPYEPEQPAG